MKEKEHVKCLIIGSGPAGYTAAIYTARADMNPVLYQGQTPGGQLTITTEVDNFPGYPKGVQGPQMMTDFEQQARRLGADIRYGWVTAVDFTGPLHKITIDELGVEKKISADTVIICTGAEARWLGLESEKRLRDMGGGVSACAVCDGPFYKGKDVAIVGAGDAACEEASYLAKLCNNVHMLIRKDHFRASKAMQHRIENIPNIHVLFNTEVKELQGDEFVEAVLIFNKRNNEERKLQVQGFFVAIGHTPNTEIFRDWLEMDDAGYISNKPGSTLTNVPGVFIAGDAADKVYRQAITAAGTGCMAALDAEKYLAHRS
ncbi:MAG: thioredoxin-disulfide reductase [Flavobacteriales bacterium]